MEDGNTKLRFASLAARAHSWTLCGPQLLLSSSQQPSLIRKSRRISIYSESHAFSPTSTPHNRRYRWVRVWSQGELSGATDSVKGRALAWCARILSDRDNSDASARYLSLALTLSQHVDVSIARALLLSKDGKRQEALTALAALSVPAAKSAAVAVVASHDGWAAAVDWFDSTGVRSADLDADGKKFLLHGALDNARWDTAFAVADAITEGDFSDLPVLRHFAAMALLLRTVPEAHRALALNQVPLDAREFPLAATECALANRRQAHTHFQHAARIARESCLPAMADADEQYATWLALRDPSSHEKALRGLQERLTGEPPYLPLVPLGVQYCPDINRQVLEREIERQTILNGSIPPNAALARLAIALTQGTPQKRASYLEIHHDQLASILTKRSLLYLQIQVLSHAGYPDRAANCLELLEREGLSNQERRFIQATISESSGDDPSHLLEEQFAQNPSPITLLRLVQELEIHASWDRLATYAGQLFEHTKSLPDAERFTRALAHTADAPKLLAFVRANPSVRSQSPKIRAHYVWALYAEGDLVAARREFATLDVNWDDADYRALHVQLEISTGDWRSLSSFVAGEYTRRATRGSADLLSAAKIALNIRSSYTKDLTFAAAEKPNVSPDLLAAAHILAIRGTFDSDPIVAEWFRSASAASGPDGPIRPVSVQEILEKQSHWAEHESKVLALWNRGDIPTYLTAQVLNRRLSQFTLLPAIHNLVQDDPRRRSAIPAYSGARPIQTEFQLDSVGIDLTALLTLDMLGILDSALDCFRHIHIPHATLSFLFEEHFEVSFHQPSLIDDAQLLRTLIATDAIRKLVPQASADPDLAASVGPLAHLIAAAEVRADASEPQSFVVRPRSARPPSFLNDDAVLLPHAEVLVSCRSVVDRLHQAGQVTANELAKAHAYLSIRERPWPYNRSLPAGAQLYLDGLAITYLTELSLLEKLCAVGPPPMVSPSALQDAHTLVSYAQSTTHIQGALDRIREALSKRIVSGQIQVDRQHIERSDGDVGDAEHPSSHLFALIPKCDSLLVDDRCVNRHPGISKDGSQATVITTLDLIAGLTARGVVSSSKCAEMRTRLRRAGYLFVPITDEELSAHVRSASVVGSAIVETAELRSIRENLLLARIGQWFDEATDAPWLDSVVAAVLRAMRRIWDETSEDTLTTARADWLLSLLELRGWPSRPSDRATQGALTALRERSVLRLIDLCIDANPQVRASFWRWLEVKVLDPVRRSDREMDRKIIEHKTNQIAAVADRPISLEDEP